MSEKKAPLAEAGELSTLAGELIAAHYDPAYDRAARKDPAPHLGQIDLPALDDAALDAAADRIVALVKESVTA